MATRPAYVWSGSDWDEIGDQRLGPSVTALTNELASKLDLAGGKILQIVRATDSTNRTTTSATYVDVTGVSVTITPQKSDSSILILTLNRTAAANGDYVILRIADSSNNALSGAQDCAYGSSANSFNAFAVCMGRDTPATTSAVTYKLRFRTLFGGVATLQNSDTTAQIYAIEVSA